MCVKKRETEIQNKNSSSISFTTAAAPDDSSAQEEGDEGGRKSSRQKHKYLKHPSKRFRNIEIAVKVRELAVKVDGKFPQNVFGKRTIFCDGAANLFHFA